MQQSFLKVSYKRRSNGFTLVEIMIVIVILGIFGALVGLSVGAGASRKHVQRYDKLVDDLKYARILAMDEQMMLGLTVRAANNINPTRYELVSINPSVFKKILKQAADNSTKETNKKFGVFDGLSVDLSNGVGIVDDAEKQQLWQPFETQFQKKINQNFTEQTQLRIQPLDATNQDGIFTDNPLLTGTYANMPVIIWYGNGEATPVKIVVYENDNQIGDAIFIDKLGRVTTDTTNAGI